MRTPTPSERNKARARSRYDVAPSRSNAAVRPEPPRPCATRRRWRRTPPRARGGRVRRGAVVRRSRGGVAPLRRRRPPRPVRRTRPRPARGDVGLGGQHRALGLGRNRGEAVSRRTCTIDVAVGELGLDEQRQQRRATQRIADEQSQPSPQHRSRGSRLIAAEVQARHRDAGGDAVLVGFEQRGGFVEATLFDTQQRERRRRCRRDARNCSNRRARAPRSSPSRLPATGPRCTARSRTRRGSGCAARVAGR